VRCCKVSSAGNNTNPSTTGIVRSHDGSSSSSEDHSGSSSVEVSAEKDVNHHEHTRGDHINSQEEGSQEERASSAEESSYQSPAEQELIAIDPEPTQFFVSNESPNSSGGDESITTADNNPMSHHHSEDHHNSVHSSEDDSLPEEIANIDQVDNSEAQHEEEEENASTASSSYSQHIPADVVNALEDVDGAGSHGHHHNIHNGATRNANSGFNLTELNEIPHDVNDGDDDYLDHDLKPKSSPRFGQVEVINSTATGTSSAHVLVFNSGVICVGSVILLYSAQFL